MAYNNYFPVGYNQPYYMPQQQAPADKKQEFQRFITKIERM